MSVKVTEEMYRRDRARKAGYIGSDVSRKPGWLNAMASEQRGGERKSVNSQCQMAARHANSVALVDELSLEEIDIIHVQPNTLDEFYRWVSY